MIIFGILSMIVYGVAFFFIGYCAKYMMETPYADLCSVVSLCLLLGGAVLSGLQSMEYHSTAYEKKWEMELDEIQKQLEERKHRLEEQTELR